MMCLRPFSLLCQRPAKVHVQARPPLPLDQRLVDARIARCCGSVAAALVGDCRGVDGFGYDPIFEVDQTGLTFAEMPLERKRELSHRGRAFALLEPRLRQLLNDYIS